EPEPSWIHAVALCPGLVVLVLALLRGERSMCAIGALIMLICAALRLVYYTGGEIDQSYLTLLFWIVFGPILAAWSWRPDASNRRALGATTVIAAYLILPWQASLCVRWMRIHDEALRIIAYAKQVRERSGSFPETLEAYEWKRESVRDAIRY